jgi:hypothetical protein
VRAGLIGASSASKRQWERSGGGVTGVAAPSGRERGQAMVDKRAAWARVRGADGRFVGKAEDAGEPRAAGKRSAAAFDRFLAQLAVSAHVEQAAAEAGLALDTLHERRRRDPAFAQGWRAAVLTGYDRIEAALIRRALGQPDAPGAKLDVQLALALLTKHRPAVERAAKEAKEAGFRAPRDVAEAVLLGKLKAYAKANGLSPPTARNEDAA